MVHDAGLRQKRIELPRVCQQRLMTGGLIVGQSIARGHRIPQGNIVDREGDGDPSPPPEAPPAPEQAHQNHARQPTAAAHLPTWG